MNRARQGALWRGLVFMVGLLLLPAQLFAESPTERLERAKALFREGNALLGAGDPERALERFLQSREAVASGKNTANAAICLERIGRYDEALEMYEQLLARFSRDLDEQDRQNLVPIMSSLRARLGSLDISSNVEGLVIIDGKPRGYLPRTTALRVRAGKRRLRVVKEGYQSFDRELDVQPSDTLSVDASLEPLRGLGALRIEQSGRGSATLLVDGKLAGVLPWEGTLPTGQHLLQAVGEQVGSMPETVKVLERKTLLIRQTLRPLGAPLRLSAVPPSADLSVDGAELGRGFWAGRLPVGMHSLKVSEVGYFPRTTPMTIELGAKPPPLQVVLQRDPAHPRWPQPGRWFWGVRATAALSDAPTLNGDAEADCPSRCVGRRSAIGGKFEAAAELLFQRKFGFELGAGYHFANQAFTRALITPVDETMVTYALRQKLAMGGAYARVAGVAELPLPWHFTMRSSLGLGVSPTSYAASASGVAWTTGDFAAAAGTGYQALSELMPFVSTSLDAERAIGPISVALGVGAWFVPTRGPTFPGGPDGVKLQITGDCAVGSLPSQVGCTRRSDVLSTERVHGPFVSLAPELSARYRF